MAFISMGNDISVSDKGWYAFNPCYIKFGDVEEITEVTISVNDISITANIVGRDAKVDISGLLQTLWANEKWEDLNHIQTITQPIIKIDTPTGTTTMDGLFDVIWGSINIDESFCAWGTPLKYVNEDIAYYRRVAKWYPNLPCALSFIQPVVQEREEHSKATASVSIVRKMNDGTDRWQLMGDNYQTDATKLWQLNNIRDKDIFSQGKDFRIDVSLVDGDTPYQSFSAQYYYFADNATDGYYLRWIDNFGLVNYYLFNRGSVSTKTKSQETIESDVVRNDYYHSVSADVRRTLEKTIKCSATSLDLELYETVKTIRRAAVIQLYVGMSGGSPVWMPVRLADSTDTDSEKPMMRDVNISIVTPLYQSQTI